MSKYTCTCEKCSSHRATDPETGDLFQGRIVGRKEFLQHAHLERIKLGIKQRLNDATGDDSADTPLQPDSTIHTSEPQREQDQISLLQGSAQPVSEENWDTIQEIQSELSRRRMAYHTIPTMGLVFASTPTDGLSMMGASSENLSLRLSPDAAINKPLIQYEHWLGTSISVLKSRGLRSDAQLRLIKDVTLAADEVYAAKNEEWLRQAEAARTQVPLPQFVIDNQCASVDGGKFLRSHRLQLDPIVLCCFLGVAISYLVMNISMARCGFLATTFRVILDLCLSKALQPSEVRSFISSIPLDVRKIFDILNLHPHTQSFICCPECYKLYPDSQDCPELCTYQPVPDTEKCGAHLYVQRVIRGTTKRFPVRKFLYHDMKAWLANMLSRPEIEEHADRNVFSNSHNPATDSEFRDIWDGKVFREFKGHDGEPFIQHGSREGRYIFSLCMDGFNPFIMKEAGKKVSVGAIYMVLLNLPVDIRYQVENMFLVGIIPGPREPSLEQINHILAPLVTDLLHFWVPGVFIKQTAHYDKGRLCFAALIPVVCDLPAARQITGLASHAAIHFCSFCKLPLYEIDNLDINSWPIRTWKEHKQSAHAWKSAKSAAARLGLYRQNGVRWSELLRLPYWDPTTFIVLDCMHSLLLGNLQRHCREIWGMDFRLEDDNFHVKPDGKTVTEDEVCNGYHVLEHGTDREVAALTSNVLRKLCQDTHSIRFSRKRKGQLVEALLQYRTKLGWPSSRAAEGDDSIELPSTQTDASAGTLKPRRNKLATGAELQDGRVKYTSAKSLSKMQSLRKGLIVALLLDLDTPSSLDELWAINKPALAKILWTMHQKGARPRISLQPGAIFTNASASVASRLSHGVTDISCLGHEQDVGEESSDSSDHSYDALTNEMSGDDGESSMSVSGNTMEESGPFGSGWTELSIAEAIMNSNPSRDALQALRRSTKVILAVSRLRVGLQARDYADAPNADSERLFYRSFEGMTDEQLIDELLNSSLNNDWANQAATKILEAAASRDRNVDEISPNEELEDAQLPKALPRASRKERVVLGRMTLAEIWIDMSKTTLPSWIGRAPPRLGDGRHGKLSADQWRTACTVNLVVTLVRLWGLKSPNDRQYRMLMNFMDLVMACKLAMNRRTTPEHIERFQLHMHRYLETAKELYVYSSLTPNHHLSLHLPRLFENFGPPHAWNCFVFERCLRWLKFIKTSNKFGELEQTLLTRFCMSQEVRILMQSTVLPDALSDLQLAFSKALNGDSRGTFWNDLWAFTPEENFPMPTNLKEVPLLSCIRENLTKGLLGGIPTKHCPSVCLTQESFSFRGMHFSIATNSLGNSYVVFNMNAGSGESWLAGSIMTIFYLPTEGTTRGPFFIIRPYLPLNTADAQFDPYRKFLFVAGQLVYEECGDLLICTPDELVCHFAHTPYKSPNISKPCIHALPLDRE